MLQEIKFVEWWLGLVLSETLSYYTYIILPQHLTNKHLFPSHHTTSHLTRSEKLPLYQRQFVRPNCRTRDHWCWTVRLQVWHPCFFALLSQTISNIRFGHTDRLLLTKERFTRFEQVVIQCRAISFQLFHGPTVYTSILRFERNLLVRLLGFHCKLREKNDITR